MFLLIKNSHIDKRKWDKCIAKSQENIIYALSWYLDIVSPHWSGLIHEVSGEYISVMPLTIKTKLGITYLAQPFFTQQLGIFSTSKEKAYLLEAIQIIKEKYLLIDYNFNTLNNSLLEESSFRNLLTTKLTYVLSLDKSYQEILDKYSTNHKRNIKKALRNGLHIKMSDNFSYIIDIFRKGKGEEIKEVKDPDYQNLYQIFLACKSKGFQKLYIAEDKHHNIIAGGLFLLFQKRLIYLFGATTPEGRETGAMTLIFDQVIKEHSKSEWLFDFEGGEMEGIGRFYKGFGGNPQFYFKLFNSRIPFFK